MDPTHCKKRMTQKTQTQKIEWHIVNVFVHYFSLWLSYVETGLEQQVETETYKLK